MAETLTPESGGYYAPPVTFSHSGTPQSLTGNGTFELAVTLSNPQGLRFLTVTVNVGSTGPLTGFKISKAAVVSGTHHDWLVNGDFNTPTQALPYASTEIAGIGTTPITSGSTFQFTIATMGVKEFKIYGKANNPTTLAFEISGGV